MLMTPAYAQALPGGGGGDFLIQLLPFVAIFAIMYFLIIRPQQKRVQQHRDMIVALRRGDTVVTGGGILGKITKVIGDNELQVEIADGVRVRVMRATVSDIKAKTEPVRESGEDEDEEKRETPPSGGRAKPAGPTVVKDKDV